MNRCPRCGLEVAWTGPSCPRCGLPRAGAPQPGAAWPGYAAPRKAHTGLAVALTIAVALLVLGGLVAAGLATGVVRLPDDSTQQPAAPQPTVADLDSGPEKPAPQAAPTPQPEGPTPAEPTDFADTYDQVSSGVALIEVTGCDWQGAGSGFLVDEDLVATAAHVVDQATQISVSVDAATVDATVVGVDESADLALLQLSGPVEGHVFEFAQADPSPGTRIAAVGFPLDQPKTLTEGTVSGLGREITTESGWFDDMMQTDTAINPGNSGGPVVTIDGSVAGIAEAFDPDAQGIAFAVPASVADPILTEQTALVPATAAWCETDFGVESETERTLVAYLDAINFLDYEAAMRQLTPEFRAETSGGPVEWADAYASTYDDRLEVISVTGSDDNPTVWAEFRSQQAPGYGPDGARNAPCLIWSIDYEMVRVGSRLLIDAATGHYASPYSRC
jgi:serine protease Do